jgi:cytochrome c oxidase cbb3-type subunit III
VKRAVPVVVPILWAAALAAISAVGCRDVRTLRPGPASDVRPAPIHVGALVPGGPLPAPRAVGYAETPYAINQGQQLFDAFNCTGCHSHGGGGMGPALMDDQWIYGSDPANLYDTISEGRPNGMPAFGARIPPEQIWQLVAYVRALGSLTPRAETPARSDHLQPRTGFAPSPATPKTQMAEHPG